MKFVDVFMMYLQTKFHVSSSNLPLGIVINPRPNCRFHAVTTSLLYILQTNYLKSCIFFEGVLLS
jgi:hypothetical protein